MKKINKIINHVKRNKVWYLLGAAALYVSYQLTKICKDKGVDKYGEPYYKNFDDEPEETEIKEMKVENQEETEV